MKRQIAKKLEALPPALTEQIYLRLGTGAAALILGVVLLLTAGIYFGLAWLILAGSFLINGLLMSGSCLAGAYSRIEGVCQKVETTGLRKRAKYLILQVDGIPLQVQLRRQKKDAVRRGDTVVVYSSDHTPVYVRGGYDLICGYYALQIIERQN